MTQPTQPIVSVGDFSTYLNNPNIDVVRATAILGYAQTLCQSYVSPLPVGAEIVILDVAERAYASVAATPQSGSGFYAEGLGTYSTERPGVTGGGLWLTENNKETLYRLADNGGSAFMIETLPATAGTGLPPWDSGGWWPWP